MKKIILFVSGLILLIVFLAGLYFYVILQQSLPQQTGNIHIEGITEHVEITFDRMGIPQVWALNERDGYFVFGYLHAADRLFQMDLTRRVAKGRLSEFFGKAVLDFDRVQRKVGHQRMASAQLDYLDEETRTKLQAYAEGVNFCVSKMKSLPFEYQILRKQFEEWTVLDALCVVSFQTWFSDFLQSPDQRYLKIMEKIGPERALKLIKMYPDWAPYTVPKTPVNSSLKNSFQRYMAGYLFGSGQTPLLMSTASNSWVIAPGKSESGACMLASDPHLELTRLPQFWYYSGLHIKDKGLDVLGISAPGLPFMVMGHNIKTAWAFTVGGIDVTEYYQEKIHPQDSTLYLTPREWQPFIHLQEIIKVDGQEDDTLVVRLTRNGPVLIENDSLKTIYSFRWAGSDMDLCKAAQSGFDLANTSNFKTFRKTVTNFGALDANWTYADSAGNIGYQLGAPLPIRPDSLGILPVPGWKKEYEWLGYRALEETPHSYNPPRGWLATCNNKQDSELLGYDLQGNFFSDRISRITELLSSKKSIK